MAPDLPVRPVFGVRRPQRSGSISCARSLLLEETRDVERSPAAQVRYRTDDDLPALGSLTEGVLELDGYPPRVPKDLDYFIAAPDALASFVATAGGEVVGHVSVSPTSSPEVLGLAQQALGVPPHQLAVVARLLVSPTHRRQGIARALLAQAVAEAALLGRVPILDVAVHFDRAIALYESSGWRRLGLVSVDITGMERLDEYVYTTQSPG